MGTAWGSSNLWAASSCGHWYKEVILFGRKNFDGLHASCVLCRESVLSLEHPLSIRDLMYWEASDEVGRTKHGILTLPSQLVLQSPPPLLYICRVHVDPHIPCTCGSPYTVYMWIPICRVHVDPHIPCTCGSPYTVYMRIPICRVHADPHIPCTCGSPYTVYMWIPIYRVHADPHIPCTCGSPYTVYMRIPIYRVHADPHIPCTCGSPYIPCTCGSPAHIEHPMGCVLHVDVQFREL